LASRSAFPLRWLEVAKDKVDPRIKEQEELALREASQTVASGREAWCAG